MDESENSRQELEIRISYLEQHIQEQDREMMHLNRRLDLLSKLLEKQALKITAISEEKGENRLNIHEKPPHY